MERGETTGKNDIKRGITGSILQKPGSGLLNQQTADIAYPREIMQNLQKSSIFQLHRQINLSIGTTHTLLHRN